MNFTFENILAISFVTLLLGVIFGGGHEWFQKVLAKINFNLKDIFITSLGFALGAIASIVLPNAKSQILFISTIVFYIGYWAWLLKRKVK
jgi:hypothetical protein